MPSASKTKTTKPKITKAKTAKPAVKKAVKKATKPAATVVMWDKFLGEKMPAFRLPATQLGEVSAKSLLGQPYVVYFYPKDDTSGCTAQACDFRDAMPAFGKLKAKVIGVSRDSLVSHEKFAKKYNLTFPLASDEEGKLSDALGSWIEKSMYGRKYMGMDRSTFVVDAKGVIRAAWRKVKVPGHIEEVRAALANLK